MAHRWQVARAGGRGAALSRGEPADGRVDDDGDAGRPLAAPRRGAATGWRSTARRGRLGRLRIAIPAKGRLREPTVALLEDAGLGPEVPGERALAFPCRNAPVEVLLVRAADIPEYVQDGVVDCGVTGADLVRERGAARQRAPSPRLRQLHARGGGAAGVAGCSDSTTSTGCGSPRCFLVSPASCSPSAASTPSSSTSPGRSRWRRGSASPTRSSTSSRAATRCARTACARSGRCSRPRRCSIGARRARRRALHLARVLQERRRRARDPISDDERA